MLHASNISKSYGAETILSNISFILNQGECVSLVGPNGCGKTTLLHIIMGQTDPDGGRVRFNPPDLEIGRLAQGLVFEKGETILSHSNVWAKVI